MASGEQRVPLTPANPATFEAVLPGLEYGDGLYSKLGRI